jgi:hypothetical protein
MYPEPELAVQLRRAVIVRVRLSRRSPVWVRLKPDATAFPLKPDTTAFPLKPDATEGHVARGGPFGTTIRVRVVG